MNRIEEHPILPIPDDRHQVKFLFNGKEYFGFEGEPVSSALIANDIKEFAIHKREDVSQGLFCANGQCSHCTLIIDGYPLKSCVTPLQDGMDIRTLIHLPDLPPDDHPLEHFEKREYKCDILVIGAGPSGLTATIELAKMGFHVILVDDKDVLGGKLVLQTHKFFGSIKDCYAGTRGIDIATILDNEVYSMANVRIFKNATIAGIFKDQKAGVFLKNNCYALIGFDGLIVSSGAREKSLIFNGNDLPGVYGAGAFQTLVNRDLVKSSKKVFILGSGNVGLIAAYHALQAGIEVLGICDILDKVSGYKVHADKIKRMGVPIYLRHTVISASGNGKIEKMTIAEVDDNFQPLLETAKTFNTDTLLIAVGLSPVDEFYKLAKKFGFKVIKAGDASEIAEASSAMFGGRIAGLEMANLLGKKVKIKASLRQKAEILKSKPGEIFQPSPVVLDENYQPVIKCDEEIPCNPCTSVCPVNAIKLKNNRGNILDIPEYLGGCTGCTICVAICPGLAITLAKRINAHHAEVIIPYEYIPKFAIGDKVPVSDQNGNYLEDAEVQKIRFNKKFHTYLITVKSSLKNGAKITGIIIQKKEKTRPLPQASFEYLPDNGVVCRCEMVRVKEIVEYIEEHKIRDVNQLKQIRVGMGSCGGKTCSTLLPQVFKKAGVEWKDVTEGTKRPLCVEIPMYAIINEESE